MVYPLSSIGSHVSKIPNEQVFRNTPLRMRGAAAYFGTFGYELDLTKLGQDELEQMKGQIAFMKKNRRLLQFGTFFRLRSPFELSLIHILDALADALAEGLRTLAARLTPRGRLRKS